MKKSYTTIFASVFALFVSAATINVSITSNAFTPNDFNANIGDQVIWTLNSGTHTTFSAAGAIPACAATWNSGTMSVVGTTFTYNITCNGWYNYGCQFHAAFGMIAHFTVGPVGVYNPVSEMGSLFYPNPCMDKITVKYTDADQVVVYDMLGNKVKNVLLDVSQNTIEIETGSLPQGVYFFRTMKEGEIVSTKKIVKA